MTLQNSTLGPISFEVNCNLIKNKENLFYLNLDGFNPNFNPIQPIFEGLPFLTAVTPPDPIMAVGPNSIICMVNIEMAIFDKNPPYKEIAGPDSLEGALSFWGPNVTPPLTNSFNDFITDPWIIYDHHANRFVAIILRIDYDNSKSYILLAYSKTCSPKKIR